jgi:hypothetical protein
VVSLKAGVSYTVSLKWKTNQPAGNASIYAGAGPLSDGTYSPTRLIADVIPASSNAVATTASNAQYQLTNSDGQSWVDMDPSRLALTITPPTDTTAIISGNADLWTATAGYNQDLAISVDGAVAAWKESGGYAGTFSPNAAAVETVYNLKAGTTYVIKLQWKANKPLAGVGIYAGAGAGSPYSPTTLTIRLHAARPSVARSTAQYRLSGSDGSAWSDVDTANLAIPVTVSGSCPAIVTGNADLWTETPGYNQDLAITVDGVVVAWKESGGRSGTFSPNAAMVQTVLTMTPGQTHVVTLRWKMNVPSSAAIRAGAGPLAGEYSPTSLSIQVGC